MDASLGGATTPPTTSSNSSHLWGAYCAPGPRLGMSHGLANSILTTTFFFPLSLPPPVPSLCCWFLFVEETGRRTIT